MLDQPSIEYIMHIKHITKDVRKEIEKSFPDEVSKATLALDKWIQVPAHESLYEAKQVLVELGTHNVVLDILTNIVMYAQLPIPFISIASMSAINHTSLSKYHSISLACEVLGLLTLSPFITLTTLRSGERQVQSNVQLDEKLNKRVQLSCYLPPMVEKPKHINNNFTSGYLTVNDSIILGFKENSHNKRIALDVINTLNQNEYILNQFIIDNYEKDWGKEVLNEDEVSLLSNEQAAMYHNDIATRQKYLEQFTVLKDILKDRTVYFTHKYDKRGRLYSQGYHFNPQGTSFEKACLDLAKQELVTGEL